MNSLAQLVVDVLIKTRLGLTDKQLSDDDFITIAGGDDMLQTFPDDLSMEKYLDEAAKLGLSLEEFKINANFNGCEYFGSHFKRRSGIWEYHPVRFSKHIENLRTTKLCDLAPALSSHMINYCWHDKRFAFLHKIYTDMRKNHPNEFPLTYLKTKKYLRYKCKGMESDL